MATWNLGSVTDRIHAMVDDIPTAISGTVLLDIVDKRLRFINTFLDVSIGSSAITEDYQEPLVSLSIAKVLRVIETQGTDASNIRLGDFSISKGQGSSASLSADKYEEEAMNVLSELKGSYNYFKALG